MTNSKKSQGHKPPREPFEPQGITITEAKAIVLSKQQKIADAIRKGNKKQATKLARSLVRSRAARIVTVHRVISNKGYRSAGFNDKRPKSNEDYERLMKTLWKTVKTTKVYQAKPLKRLYIAKPKGGLRPLSIPTYFDRCIQGLFKLALEVFQEEKADKFSFGFRTFRSPAWAAKALWLLMNNQSLRGPPKYVIEMDIKKCYDRIDHNWLLNNIPFIPRHLLKEWLQCGFVQQNDSYTILHPTTGTPQGGLISPILCNLTLDGMEEAVTNRLQEIFGKDRQNWSRLVRYADDTVILVYSEEAAREAIRATQEFLKPRGLELNLEKTKITKWTEENFEFVGFRFSSRIANNKIKIFYDIPPHKIKKMFEKLKRKAKQINKTTTLFLTINPIIRGFCQFYAFSNSCSQFRKIRHRLFWVIYQNLYRIYKTQPDRVRKTLNLKNKTRIKRKHRNLAMFINHKRTIRRRNNRAEKWWGIYPTNDAPRGVILCNPTNIKTGQGPTLSGKSAFHLDDIPKLNNVALRYKSGFLGRILKKTKGCCKICNTQLLREKESYELHHKIPFAYGGRTTENNMIILCTECHKSVTKAVTTKNIEQLLDYEEIGVLGSIVIDKIINTQSNSGV